MRGDSRIKHQIDVPCFGSSIHSRRGVVLVSGHGHPLLGSGVAHDIAKLVRRPRLEAMLQEEESIAGVQEGEELNLGPLHQEGEARVDVERHRSSHRNDETEAPPAAAAAVVLLVHEEEALTQESRASLY